MCSAETNTHDLEDVEDQNTDKVENINMSSVEATEHDLQGGEKQDTEKIDSMSSTGANKQGLKGVLDQIIREMAEAEVPATAGKQPTMSYAEMRATMTTEEIDERIAKLNAEFFAHATPTKLKKMFANLSEICLKEFEENLSFEYFKGWNKLHIKLSFFGECFVSAFCTGLSMFVVQKKDITGVPEIFDNEHAEGLLIWAEYVCGEKSINIKGLSVGILRSLKSSLDQNGRGVEKSVLPIFLGAVMSKVEEYKEENPSHSYCGHDWVDSIVLEIHGALYEKNGLSRHRLVLKKVNGQMTRSNKVIEDFLKSTDRKNLPFWTGWVDAGVVVG